MIGDRNNTNFQYNLYNYLKNVKLEDNDYLKYHQKIVLEYILNYDKTAGILIYHRMGSGKTMTSVTICEELIHKTNKNIIFVSPKSLHNNFIKEFYKYNEINNKKKLSNEEIENHIKNKYTFISSNASNSLTQFKKAINKNRLKDLVLELDENEDTNFIELDNSIIVWDEFHNFTNSLASGNSKNATGIYDILTTSKNVKIIALTGTPIINDPFELVLSMNIFAGKKIFSDYYSDFTKNFIETFNDDINKKPTIKNKDILQDRILGLVSYYGADDKEFLKNFPKKYQMLIQKVRMSNEQFIEYAYYRDIELKQSSKSFSNIQGRFKSTDSSSSSYRIGSRQVSNFLFPENAIKRSKNEDGKIIIQKFIEKLISNNFTKENLLIYSPKIHELLTTLSLHLPNNLLNNYKPNKENIKNIINNIKKINNITEYSFGIGNGLIYSQFVESGIAIIGKALEHNGFIDITINTNYTSNSENNITGHFAYISGDVNADRRKELIDIYNSKDNINGKLLNLLLITSTGAEGLDLKNCRHVHILEPYWNYSRIDQIITRAVRFKSHSELDVAQQNVQSYIYLSIYPKDIDTKKNKKIKTVISEPSTDIMLYIKSIKNQLLIDEFLQVLQESSIDCLLHNQNNKNIKCRICEPNNKPLFTNNLDNDINEGSKCKHYKEEKIIATPITIVDNDIKYEYMYSINNGEYNIYVYDKELNGYIPIDETNNHYYTLLYEIKNKNFKK